MTGVAEHFPVVCRNSNLASYDTRAQNKSTKFELHCILGYKVKDKILQIVALNQFREKGEIWIYFSFHLTQLLIKPIP